MIRRTEIEQVREINRKLPFADPIEPGPTFSEWAEGALDIKLLPAQIRLGERLLMGDTVMVARRAGVSFTRRALQRYIEAGADRPRVILAGSEDDPNAPFVRVFK